MIWSRDSTRPGLCASTTSRSNWWLVRSHSRPVQPRLARAEVDLEAAEAQHFVRQRLGRRAAQQRLDARQQLARLEGLGQVVVGAQLEADDAVDGLAARGEHQQRQAARAGVGAQLAREVEAVAVGQHEVEHQRVVRLLAQPVAAGGDRAGGVDRIAGTAQVLAHHGGEARVVVDQQQAGGGVHRERESPGTEGAGALVSIADEAGRADVTAAGGACAPASGAASPRAAAPSCRPAARAARA